MLRQGHRKQEEEKKKREEKHKKEEDKKKKHEHKGDFADIVERYKKRLKDME
ncbi:hypothetical protein ACFLQO_00840 [Candidatus Aenigmatarchaeota archaeon]